MWLTLVCEEHLGERRHSDQEVQHSAAVGVVRAVVVRLDGRHGVVLTNALLVLLFEVLHNNHTMTCFHSGTSNKLKKHMLKQASPCNYPRSDPLSLSTELRWVCLNSCNGNNSITNDSCVMSIDFRETLFVIPFIKKQKLFYDLGYNP